jgi:hypothetical protein
MNRPHRVAFLGVCVIGLGAKPAPAVELLGKDRMFIRFTNTRPDQTKVLIRLNIVPNHDKPFSWTGKTIYVGRDGEAEKPAPSRFVAPGEITPWVDVGRYMNKQGERSWATYLSPLLCGVMTEPQADGLFILAEVAQGPGTKLVRRLEIRKPDLPARPAERKYPWLLGYSVWNGSGPLLPTLGLLVPTQPDLGPRVYTLEEALNHQLEVIRTFPDVGRLPTRIVFKTSDHQEVCRALGYNGYPADTVEGNLGDEISLDIKMPAEEQNRRFREYLKGRNLDPLALLKDEDAARARRLPREKQWELVALLPPLPGRPVHFYESANFRYQLWYEELAARTKEIEAKNPAKRVLCGANFSPHMNVWPDVRQWIGPFKAGAMTMSWTEDWWWQLPEVSPQVYGFLLDGLRLAGGYHGAPMQFYIMPFKGQSQDNFRRMHGLAYAHGAKIINHFVTQNQAMVTWDYVDQIESPRTHQAIHDMIRDAGAVEHRLFPAMPQRAQIAIMLSRAADTWDTEDLGGAGHLYGAKFNVNNDERKAIWMALRHAQYPVDLITDEDIAEGKLAGYRVLYVVGSEMLSATVRPLKQWVRDGGLVYATGGCALFDEYHRDLVELHDVYGITAHRFERAVRHIRPRGTLPGAKPLDEALVEAPELGFASVRLPALCCRETFQPSAGARILGRYRSDGSPAVVYNAFGKGGVYSVGALVGLAYLTPATRQSSDVLPTTFPADPRAIIALPATQAKVVPVVAASDPLVEAQYLVGSNGALVTLTNWREKPVEKLILRFPGREQVKTVRSLRAAGHFKGHLHEQSRGGLPVHVVDGVPQVELRLEVTDFLFVD